MAVLGHGLSLIALEETDQLRYEKYTARMQAEFATDPRFQRIEFLSSFSADYMLFPYIPLTGTVPTAQDRKELGTLLISSAPPFYVSASGVQIGSEPSR